MAGFVLPPRSQGAEPGRWASSLDLALFQNLLHGVGQGEVTVAALRQAAAPGPGCVSPWGPGAQPPQALHGQMQELPTARRRLQLLQRPLAVCLGQLLGTFPQESEVLLQDPGSAARVAGEQEADPLLAELSLHLPGWGGGGRRGRVTVLESLGRVCPLGDYCVAPVCRGRETYLLTGEGGEERRAIEKHRCVGRRVVTARTWHGSGASRRNSEIRCSGKDCVEVS